mgnify:CR=1 FL=1
MVFSNSFLAEYFVKYVPQLYELIIGVFNSEDRIWCKQGKDDFEVAEKAEFCELEDIAECIKRGIEAKYKNER